MAEDETRDGARGGGSRVSALERRMDRLDGRQDRLQEAIDMVRADLRDTERRLADRLEAKVEDLREDLGGRIDRVDAHVSGMGERFATAVRVWPSGAYILAAGALALAGGLVLAFSQLAR